MSGTISTERHVLKTVKHLVPHSNPWIQSEIKCKVQIWGLSVVLFDHSASDPLLWGVHLRIMVGALLDLLLGSESSTCFHRPQWQTCYGHPERAP